MQSRPPSSTVCFGCENTSPNVSKVFSAIIRIDNHASHPVATGISFPMLKQQEHEPDHTPPSSDEVKTGAIPLLLHTSLHF
jgi:hypothetical protein